jgi:hypothetical protein
MSALTFRTPSDRLHRPFRQAVFTMNCRDYRPRNQRKGIWAGHDVSLSSQQTVHFLQFGGDVDLLRAGHQAVATADARRAVPR